MNLERFRFLGANRNFSASIGSFQGLPAELSEVILLSQRLALKYNTTPWQSCQHFLTSFFQFLCEGLNSLSQSLTALPAPSGREPLARPQTLRFSRELYRYAKGPILEDDFPRPGEDVAQRQKGESVIERSEMTGGVFSSNVSSPILLHYIGRANPDRV